MNETEYDCGAWLTEPDLSSIGLAKRYAHRILLARSSPEALEAIRRELETDPRLSGNRKEFLHGRIDEFIGILVASPELAMLDLAERALEYA